MQWSDASDDQKGSGTKNGGNKGRGAAGVFGNHPVVHGLGAFECLRVGRIVHEHHPLHRSIVRIDDRPEIVPATHFLHESSGKARVSRPLWTRGEGGTQIKLFTVLPWMLSILVA